MEGGAEEEGQLNEQQTEEEVADNEEGLPCFVLAKAKLHHQRGDQKEDAQRQAAVQREIVGGEVARRTLKGKKIFF